MSLPRYNDPGLAEQYSKYRPDYPTDLYEYILKYCDIQPGCRQSLAIDLACGTGKSTRPLAEHFDRVIGIDISQGQIDNAQTDLPNVDFRVGPAEDLSFLPDESVDLITCGTGLHWLNMDKLFPDVKRVLRCGGAFVAYSYGPLTLDCESANQHLHDVSWLWNWQLDRELVNQYLRGVKSESKWNLSITTT